MPIAVRVKNQKPGILDPIYVPSVKGDYNVKKLMSKVYSKTFRQAMVQSSPVDIMINSQNVSDDEIWDLMLACCTGTVRTDEEEAVRSLLHQTLAYYNPNTKLLFKEMFAVANGVEAGLAEPDPVTIYTPAQDVIPAAAGFLRGTKDYSEFFASFAYYCRLEAFGVYFVNEQAFSDFKTWFQQQVNLMTANLDAACLALISDFMQMKLANLTESFRLRNDVTENMEDFCFARVFVSCLMQYFGNTKLAGLMPFDTEELFCPKNIVIINVERFAHASPAAIANEINDIKQSINIANKVQMVSNRKLNQLAPIARALRKTQSMAAAAGNNRFAPAMRAKRTAFKSRIMTRQEYLQILQKVLEKMKSDKRTMNVYKHTKSSFAKPNRRDPDNYNLQGKIVSTKYRPDLHLYIDTSGSISEDNYKATLKLCIQLAKKLNVNLYVNTFSHVISQTSLLNCKDKTISEIYAKFQNTPKVTGGTDFAQIWRFINSSKKRSEELSIMITDFEWMAPSSYIKHPKYLYYIPCANMNWSNICHSADDFVKSCLHNDPTIRAKLLA